MCLIATIFVYRLRIKSDFDARFTLNHSPTSKDDKISVLVGRGCVRRSGKWCDPGHLRLPPSHGIQVQVPEVTEGAAVRVLARKDIQAAANQVGLRI